MSIKELLRKCHLKLVFMPIEGKGYLLKTPKKNLLIVSNALSDSDTEKVILHEIGHVLADQETAHDYKYNYRSHLCSEHAANGFMVHEMVEKYIALGNDAGQANYIDLAMYLGTDDFKRVKNELLRLKANESD